MKKEALLYDKLKDLKVGCFLCSHRCNISNGNFGICGVRRNIDGVLYTLSYGCPIALNVDPIEKKPLFNFLVGTKSYSIATKGCNFRCGFCQNWQISQDKNFQAAGQRRKYSPANIVKMAVENNCESISYTYTEPTIFFEYAQDIAKIAKKEGLANIFVTNGFMTKDAILAIKPYLDAVNVDLKSFSDKFYKDQCGGRLAPVLDSIRLMHELDIWVEVTTLVIPGLNDSKDELGRIAEFIAGVDKRIPWHISKFHPDYKMSDSISTSDESLEFARRVGEDKGLRYVYVGNVLEEENTLCYSCKKIIIRRMMFKTLENNIRDGKCLYCNCRIDGVKLTKS